jgi:hypothetical protein
MAAVKFVLHGSIIRAKGRRVVGLADDSGSACEMNPPSSFRRTFVTAVTPRSL